MALRRVIVLVIAAACVLVGAAQALAAPQWLLSEPLESTMNGTVPADVAADADGNAVALWIAEGEVRASYRPRGGPWSAPENLDPGAAIHATQPRVTVQPDGEFVAVWVVDGAGSSLRWARRPAGADWSDPATVTGISSPPAVGALEASADGSVTVMTLGGGVGKTNTKPAGSETWGPDENVGLPQGPRLAVAPDGSAVAVAAGSCGSATNIPCLRAAFRPAGGPWGTVEPVANFASGRFDTGFEVAATPASSFTVVWGEAPSEGNSGSVLSADREPGAAGGWATSQTIEDLPNAIPGCRFLDNCFDVVTGPDGRELAAWQETGTSANALVAALRVPADAWGGPETAGPIDTDAAVPFAALTAAEVPVLAWGSAISGEGVARGAHRDATGWQPVTLADGSRGGPPPANGVYLGDLVADGEGNAVTAWEDPSGADASGFDGIGPRFSAFSLPSGPATQALAFSAAADDNWSGVSGISWLFGDGAGADGAITSHAYGAAGSYTATATATDAIGNTTEQSGPVNVGAAPVPTPTPDPCGTGDKDKDGIKDGCDTNDGSKPPVAFKTFNATVVSGDVFVKLPAGAARVSAAKPPKGFVRLTGAETIPVGATLDTAKGRVRLRTAADTRKHVQTGDFFRGRFVVRQVRKPRSKSGKRSTKLITELRLTGSSFSRACRSTTASVAAKRRSKKKVRRLFGDGKGSFRTRGRNAAATVRGTRWSVQDRCDGTLVTVQRGRVEVRDLVRHRTVFVRTGHTYLARRR